MNFTPQLLRSWALLLSHLYNYLNIFFRFEISGVLTSWTLPGYGPEEIIMLTCDFVYFNFPLNFLLNNFWFWHCDRSIMKLSYKFCQNTVSDHTWYDHSSEIIWNWLSTFGKWRTNKMTSNQVLQSKYCRCDTLHGNSCLFGRYG